MKFEMCTARDLGFMFGFLSSKVCDLIKNPLEYYRSGDVTELKKLILTLLVTFDPPSVRGWMHAKSEYLDNRTPVEVFGEFDGPKKVRAAFEEYQEASAQNGI